jgi:hypothetical protein
VDQDPLCKAGDRIKNQGGLEVWARELCDGTRAVVFHNRTTSTADINIDLSAIGLDGSTPVFVRDIWKKTSSEHTGAVYTYSGVAGNGGCGFIRIGNPTSLDDCVLPVDPHKEYINRMWVVELLDSLYPNVGTWDRIDIRDPAADATGMRHYGTNISFIIGTGGAVRSIALFSVSGQLVRALSGVRTMGGVIISWDRTDTNGNTVLSGTYIVNMVTDDAVYSKTFMLF